MIRSSASRSGSVYTDDWNKGGVSGVLAPKNRSSFGTRGSAMAAGGPISRPVSANEAAWESQAESRLDGGGEFFIPECQRGGTDRETRRQADQEPGSRIRQNAGQTEIR